MINPLELMDRYQTKMSNFEAWPGFKSLEIPLAIFDGDKTYLWRHPAPPEPFEETQEHSDIWVMPGRHPGLVANSVLDLDGVVTATILYLPTEHPDVDWLPVMAHEAFHVYQQVHFAQQSANEADLFLYPFDNLAHLVKRRLETYALKRALAADRQAERSAWARAALAYRRERFGLLPEASAAYERATETMEGTATYVEYRVGKRQPELPSAGFGTTQLRTRSYQTGAAFCFLLDDVLPGWQLQFENDASGSLDTLLSTALAAESHQVDVAAENVALIRIQAERDIEQLKLNRKQQRTDFEHRPGWMLTLVASSKNPLRLEGFDPMNVELVEGGVLHHRYLKLVSDGARLEIIGARCLTEAHGHHPLFAGIKRVAVHLEGQPQMSEAGDGVHIKSNAVTATLYSAEIETEGQHITIAL